MANKMAQEVRDKNACIVRSKLKANGWGENLIDFATEWMKPAEVNENFFRELEVRLAFIRDNIPPKKLKKIDEMGKNQDYPSSQVPIFITSTRIFFLEALNHLTESTIWDTVIDHPEVIIHWSSVAKRINQPKRTEYHGIDPSRKKIPILVDKGKSDRATEVRVLEFKDALQRSGLVKIISPLVKHIVCSKITEPFSTPLRYHGTMQGVEEMGLSFADEARVFLIPIVLHEMGHAAEYHCYYDNNLLQLLTKYFIISQLEETVLSNYANSFIKTDGRGSSSFISESFAEDSRLYWMWPEQLSDRKRDLFTKVYKILLPQINPAQVRLNIRLTLGNYYSSNVTQVLKKMNGKSPEEALMRRRYF